MKLLKRIGAILIVAVIAAVAVFWTDIQDMRAVMTYVDMFEPETIDENFRSMHESYPNVAIKRSGAVAPLETASADLPKTFIWKGQELSIEDWIDNSQTTGLVILKDGKLVQERYFRGNKADDRVIVMSVSKSVVSFLIGKAVEDGHIASLQDPVDKYDSALKGSGYEGVRLKDVLQMSSGIAWNEDYADLESDIVQSVISMLNGDLNEFAATRQNEKKPGTYNRYASIDTHVLGMVLEGATGKKLAQYAEETLWSKIGAEYDIKLMTDAAGNPVSFGGFNIATRDMARIGQLYLNGGKNWKGEQLVNADWIAKSGKADAPHLQPGKDNPNSDWPMGYGYQWWIPENAPNGTHPGDYSAIGIYGQFIYVSPEHNVVIAKSSAYEDYNETGDEMEFQAMEVFRAIAAGL